MINNRQSSTDRALQHSAAFVSSGVVAQEIGKADIRLSQRSGFILRLQAWQLHGPLRSSAVCVCRLLTTGGVSITCYIYGHVDVSGNQYMWMWPCLSVHIKGESGRMRMWSCLWFHIWASGHVFKSIYGNVVMYLMSHYGNNVKYAHF